jgi:hypothetical protein
MALRLVRVAQHCLEHQNTSSDGAGEEYLDEAADLMHQSMVIRDASPVKRMINALSFVYKVETLPKEYIGQGLRRSDRLLRLAIDLLPQTALSAVQNDQRHLLSTLYGLPRYAAAAALENGGEPFEALQLLERGRGILISAHIDPQNDLALLRSHHPELEKDYLDIRRNEVG